MMPVVIADVLFCSLLLLLLVLKTLIAQDYHFSCACNFFSLVSFDYLSIPKAFYLLLLQGQVCPVIQGYFLSSYLLLNPNLSLNLQLQYCLRKSALCQQVLFIYFSRFTSFCGYYGFRRLGYHWHFIKNLFQQLKSYYLLLQYLLLQVFVLSVFNISSVIHQPNMLSLS